MSKPDYAELRAKLKTYRADPESVLKYLDDLAEECMSGITDDMNTARGDVVQATRKYPDTALRATQEKWKVAQYILDRAEQETEDTELIIRIDRARPAGQS